MANVGHNNYNEDAFHMIRKHDAVLIFHTEDIDTSRAMQTSYKGFDNWFKKTVYNEILDRVDDLFFSLTA